MNDYRMCGTVKNYGCRQDLCAKLFADSGRMRSAGNRGVVQSRL